MAQNQQKDAPAALYGVFLGSKWGMTRDREVALQAARGFDGAEVREVASYSEADAWDAPTFRALSDRIYPTPQPAEASWPKAIC
jgi:hypothetical protein